MLGSGYVAPFAEALPSGGTPYGPAFIQSQNPAAWFRFGMGITVVTGVSQWNDQTANARHLLQATGAAQPALQADGSILFDGVDDSLKCNTFTFNQPETIYILFKQVAWTNGMHVYDGNVATVGRIIQSGVTPQIIANAGASLSVNADLAVGVYGVASTVFNGATSLYQVNNGTPTTGNAGANNMAGLTLGARGDNTTFSNIQVKEIILFPAAHNESVRAGVVQYLAGVGGIAL